jgi:hypothetical protein
VAAGHNYAIRGLRVHGQSFVLGRAGDTVGDLMNPFIEMLAFGAVVQDGQPVRMNALPEGWRCFHRGTLDDPDFNNRHIEIGPDAEGEDSSA